MQSGELKTFAADAGWVTPCTNLTAAHCTSPPDPAALCWVRVSGPSSALAPADLPRHLLLPPERAACGPSAQKLGLSPMNYFQQWAHHFFVIVQLLGTGSSDRLVVLLTG